MKKILVIGDALIDSYVRCEFKKMCDDSPTMPALVESSRDERPGGAANVALNICALLRPNENCRVDLISVVDLKLGKMIDKISKYRLSMDYSVFDSPMKKTRYFDEDKPVVRIDDRFRFTQYVDEQVEKKLKSYLANHEPDIILWSDYSCDTVGPLTFERLLSRRDRMIVDTKKDDLSVFAASGRKTLGVKLNRQEWSAAVAKDPYPERFFEFMIVTNGSAGSKITVYNDDDGIKVHTMNFDAFAASVVDVCGCGDTFMAGYTVSYMRTGDRYDAMRLASAAASTVVSQFGTSIADRVSCERLLGNEVF